MDIRQAAESWARSWAESWPRRDAEPILAHQAPDGDHYASMFRRYHGVEGLRRYLTECFAEEVAPCRTRFARPRVDGDLAAVEYWTVIRTADGPQTISGCTVLRFDERGRVAVARDYSHVRAGDHPFPDGFDWLDTAPD